MTKFGANPTIDQINLLIIKGRKSIVIRFTESHSVNRICHDRLTEYATDDRILRRKILLNRSDEFSSKTECHSVNRKYRNLTLFGRPFLVRNTDPEFQALWSSSVNQLRLSVPRSVDRSTDPSVDRTITDYRTSTRFCLFKFWIYFQQNLIFWGF